MNLSFSVGLSGPQLHKVTIWSPIWRAVHLSSHDPHFLFLMPMHAIAHDGGHPTGLQTSTAPPASKRSYVYISRESCTDRNTMS
jgi:hypothetical protein